MQNELVIKNPFCNKMGHSKTDILKVNIYAQSNLIFEKFMQEYVQKMTENSQKVVQHTITNNKI